MNPLRVYFFFERSLLQMGTTWSPWVPDSSSTTPITAIKSWGVLFLWRMDCTSTWSIEKSSRSFLGRKLVTPMTVNCRWLVHQRSESLNDSIPSSTWMVRTFFKSHLHVDQDQLIYDKNVYDRIDTKGRSSLIPFFMQLLGCESYYVKNVIFTIVCGSLLCLFVFCLVWVIRYVLLIDFQ